MKPIIATDRCFLFHGNSKELDLKEIADSVVTDPPYELGFMGKKWDAGGIAYDVNLWHRVYRALKPGGHLLAFGGTRTYHRMACAIEDAGFEIRDSLHWVYGSGFPKSLNVSKAIDDSLGAERKVVGANPNHRPVSGVGYEGVYAGGNTGAAEITSAGSPEAARWEGWGTALKPAHEPIILARKPLEGTVAANVLAHGTGGLNVDGCRIGDEVRFNPKAGGNAFQMSVTGMPQDAEGRTATGRWPANFVLSHSDDCEVVGNAVQRGKAAGGSGVMGYHGADGVEERTPEGPPVEVDVYRCAEGCPVAELDAQSGKSQSRKGKPRKGKNGDGWGMESTGSEYDDLGGASRFFYCAKPSRREREFGCEGLPSKTGGEATDRVDGSDGLNSPRAGANRKGGRSNFHPTVKPIELMRWLCRLVTPPGGVVLDPFAGSGTTGIAALKEGFEFIGVELTDEYIPIVEARLRAAMEMR